MLGPDAKRFLEWLRVGYPPDSLMELRVLPAGGRQGQRLSGFYDDLAKMLDAAATWDGKEQVYVGLNPRRTMPKAHRALAPGETAKDTDVVATVNILIDFDPERASGFSKESATQEELESAHQRALDADAWLQGLGFNPPLVVASGNGFHLLVKIIPQDDAIGFSAAVKAFLAQMSDRFTDALVKVDTSVANASRITKLAGAMAIKGANTPDRPWRRSRIARWVEPVFDVKATEYIAALVAATADTNTTGKGVYQIPQSAATQRERGQEMREPSLEDSTPRPDWELRHVLHHCRFIQHARESAATLSEPLWYGMVTNLIHFEHGDRAIHDLSKPYPGYSVQETSVKIEHARRDAPGPHTCETIAQNGFKCPLLGTCPAKAPLVLAVADLWAGNVQPEQIPDQIIHAIPTKVAKLFLSRRKNRENAAVAGAVHCLTAGIPPGQVLTLLIASGHKDTAATALKKAHAIWQGKRAKKEGQDHGRRDTDPDVGIGGDGA